MTEECELMHGIWSFVIKGKAKGEMNVLCIWEADFGFGLACAVVRKITIKVNTTAERSTSCPLQNNNVGLTPRPGTVSDRNQMVSTCV